MTRAVTDQVAVAAATPSQRTPISGSTRTPVSSAPFSDSWILRKLHGLVLKRQLGLLPQSIMLELLLAEDTGENSSERSEQQLALSKALDNMILSMEKNPMASKSNKEKHWEYENECREKLATNDAQLNSEAISTIPETCTTSETSTSKIKLSSPDLACQYEEHVEEVRMLDYQRKITVLYELLSACLADIHYGDKKSTRRRKGYDARHRVALRLLATWLDINWMKMEAIEIIVACSAMAMAKERELKEEESKSPKSKWAKWKSGGIIGAAAVTGGALLAITGGLAAPAIAAGLSALAPTLGTLIPVIGATGFAAVASAAGTVVGSVAVAASFGAAGAGLTGTKMARRIGSVDEFEFKAIGENQNQGRLAVEILVSGLVFDEEDFVRPWEGQNDNLERYAIQWESKNLIAVSTAIQDWITSRVAMGLMKQGAMMTVLSTLLVALAWPATLLAATDFIDSKWTIALDRSDKAGKLLAEVLRKGLHGNRPVTLIGFSLGARMIFKCLEVLAETEQNAEFVERVVLLGAPVAIQGENWKAARKMVAGRFVNAYSTNDWTLGFAFRASMFSKGLAGIQPADFPGIENVDVTEIIEGHSSYLWATYNILDRLELDTYFPTFRILPSRNLEKTPS
ncbi:hypothetical protein SAY86_017047 [Trapa natans]|uniref:Transmembrane and coiled-coil domain-containing protein 4 n=1 Tax=Trapa natans TaxID=22666 RepID=A0AAN7M0R1_TRANT|nr:hypothetical protein SAY86_017047 [Trapa natans]